MIRSVSKTEVGVKAWNIHLSHMHAKAICTICYFRVMSKYNCLESTSQKDPISSLIVGIVDDEVFRYISLHVCPILDTEQLLLHHDIMLQAQSPQRFLKSGKKAQPKPSSLDTSYSRNVAIANTVSTIHSSSFPTKVMR